MSNLHGLGAQKNQMRQPINPNQSTAFRGTARTLDGAVIQTPDPPPQQPTMVELPERPDGPYEYETQVVSLETMIPPELNSRFWSNNEPMAEQFNCRQFCCLSYCPCCVGPPCSDARKQDWINLLKTFTFWVCLVEIALYIAMVAKSHDLGWELEPNIDVLLQFGANSRYKVQCEYHYHRLLSYNLLHGSWLHILFNILSQFLFTLPFEKAWSTWKFVIIFVVSGLTGGLLSDMRKSSVSVGASCSIFGIMGTYLVLVWIYWSRLLPLVKRQMLMIVIIIPVLFIAMSFLPNVDWLGHLGGLVGGISCGAMVFANKAVEKKWKMGFGIAGAILTILLFAIPLCTINLTNKDNCEF